MKDMEARNLYSSVDEISNLIGHAHELEETEAAVIDYKELVFHIQNNLISILYQYNTYKEEKQCILSEPSETRGSLTG